MSVTSDQHPPMTSLVAPGDEPAQVTGAGRFLAAEIVFDLADLDPSRKDLARAGIAQALEANDYGDALVAVRVNPIDSMWAYRDNVDVGERAGEFVDGIVVPRVTSPGDIEFVDTLVGMIEQRILLHQRWDATAWAAITSPASTRASAAATAFTMQPRRQGTHGGARARRRHGRTAPAAASVWPPYAPSF